LEKAKQVAEEAERQAKLELARREAEDAKRAALDAEKKLDAANAALAAEQAQKTLESERVKARVIYGIVGGLIVLLVITWTFLALMAKRNKKFASELGTSKRVNELRSRG
jgi:hypothetical protein